MLLKDILVCMNNHGDSVAGISAVLALARAHNAHLTGLYLSPIVDRQQAQIESIEATARVFTEAAKQANVNADWITAHSDFSSPVRVVGAFINYARLADLTILRHDVEVTPAMHRGQVLESVILGSGRPVLMLPYSEQHSEQNNSVGKRVIVAWDHSKEAARAVHDALPILQQAETVEIVTVGLVATSAIGEEVPGTALCKHLSWHGIEATASKIRALETSVGEALIGSAERANADLIILGAYGHSKAKELMLAEVTGDLLENTKTAVFLSH